MKQFKPSVKAKIKSISKKLNIKLTHTLPKKPGFYWFTNFGEHTPTVLQVTKDFNTGKLFASNEEFSFEINKEPFVKDPELKVDGHYYGENMWGKIPLPTLKGKPIEIDSY